VKSQADIYFQAVRSRDPRFDGRFFVGVKTTGIYCRPTCPAKPKRENVEFFPSRLAAERAGYRPCLRCRPESAPASPAWIGSTAVVNRALRLIGEGRLLEESEDEFAASLGVTARHLRRLFDAELGKTPKRISDDFRLDLARKLLVESRLPMAEVAYGAGFASLRRFNDAIQKRFHRAPRELRRGKAGNAGEGPGLTLGLAYRPPFDWKNLLAWHRAHHLRGIETVGDTRDGATYHRVFRHAGKIGAFSLSPIRGENSLRLRIVYPDPSALFPLVQRIRRMFDLDSDPLVVANAFAPSSFASGLVKRFPGLRIARGWDPFETAVTTILGQLVSVRQAQALAGELIRSYGERVADPLTGGEAFVFPTPTRLATASLSSLGTTNARRKAIREFSARVAKGDLKLDASADIEATKKAMLAIPGIGPWTAEYVALRALGDPDAFPASDLVLRRETRAHPDFSPEDLKPWRGYAAVYLWQVFAEKKK
jgi:AraC family transcriptional regulator of adaptative response / DNA-3-methyladenine glycosylase II